MQALSDLSKNKILESLPAHFVEQNIDDIIHKLQELKGNNWNFYVYDLEDGRMLNFTKTKITKDQVKSSLIIFIEAFNCSDVHYESLEDGEIDILKDLPSELFPGADLNELEGKILDQQLSFNDARELLANFFDEQLAIENKNYKFRYLETFFVILSCQDDYIKDQFEKLLNNVIE